MSSMKKFLIIMSTCYWFVSRRFRNHFQQEQGSGAVIFETTFVETTAILSLPNTTIKLTKPVAHINSTYIETQLQVNMVLGLF